MKQIFSLIAAVIVCVVLLQYRLSYSEIRGNNPVKVTTWDAFGYYIYLPGTFIYHDLTRLKWVPPVDEKYKVTGGTNYAAEMQKNGNYAFKYLGGVAIMESPLFLIAGFIARHTGYPPDGFSPPYQYTLSFGVLLYCMLAIFLLRKILLLYFSDFTAAITLIMVCLATNFIQYAAIDNCQSHSYIFVLYVLMLYATIQWHHRQKIIWAALTGYIAGLAIISRPTEAIIFLIPLLWNTHNKEAAKDKWQIVRQHRSHIYAALIAGFIGILPQLIYWKYATGAFIFDVGSKWDFLSPHFRVLFGWEKGWFIYTPVTVLFIAGLFFIKKYPFAKSVLWFSLLNIYIIISWHIWRYGGSYSTRALVESYPVLALPFAAVTQKISNKKWCAAYYILCAYLLAVNLFQIVQYNKTILHYDDMNRRYYASIYLNPSPTPLDMSLLDNDEMLTNLSGYTITPFADTSMQLTAPANMPAILVQKDLNAAQAKFKDEWIRVESNIAVQKGYWHASLNCEIQKGDSVKKDQIRLDNAISKEGSINPYAFYIHVPCYFRSADMRIYVSSPFDIDCTVRSLHVSLIEK